MPRSVSNPHYYATFEPKPIKYDPIIHKLKSPNHLIHVYTVSYDASIGFLAKLIILIWSGYCIVLVPFDNYYLVGNEGK